MTSAGRHSASLIYGACSVAGLAAVTLAAHGWSLGDGLFLDDHWHQEQLARTDFSPRALLETTTIRPQDFMEHWWQQRDIRWQYARPFSVLLQKIAYRATGGDVPAQHAVSILLHGVNTCLVWWLCLLVTRHRGWSLVGGALFAVYPHSVVTVAWLASQNAVLQTGLMLGSVLMYARATSLDWSPDAPPARPRRIKPGVFGLALVLWILALFSRENAIVLPGVWLAMDLAYGGLERVKAHRKAYVLAAVLMACYLCWRLGWFYHPMPDVYVRRPDDGGLFEYLLWCTAKLMHYLCCAVWPTPLAVGPTGRFNPFLEAPGDIVLMLAILVSLGGGYWLCCRRVRGWWIWPTWILLAIVPVVPVLATPHSGYQCGVGFALGMAVAAAAVDKTRRPVRAKAAGAVAIIFLLGTGAYVKASRLMWKGMTLAERYTLAPILDDRPPETVTDVFFVNLPFVNVYSELILSRAWEVPRGRLRLHALVYSPQLVRMEQRFTLQQNSSHSFSVCVEGRPYFSGLLGRFLIDGMRRDGPFQAGQTIRGDCFDVRIVQASAEGVGELTFTFDQPLTSDRYRFYVTSFDCGALPIRFQPTESADVADPLLGKNWPQVVEWWRGPVDDRMLSALFAGRDAVMDMRHRRDELRRGRALVRRYLRCDLYLTGAPFPGPR